MPRYDGHVSKFMPRFDGPYIITAIHADASIVTLNMPNSSNIYHTFHMSEVISFHKNDAELFSSCKNTHPGPVITDDGKEEWLVKTIIDSRHIGHSFQYLVRFTGYGPEEDRWLAGHKLKDNAALTVWLDNHIL